MRLLRRRLSIGFLNVLVRKPRVVGQPLDLIEADSTIAHFNLYDRNAACGVSLDGPWYQVAKRAPSRRRPRIIRDYPKIERALGVWT